MAMSSVGNWAIVELHMCGLELTLVRELDKSGWTTFAVLGMRPICLTVPSPAGGLITVHTMKMLESPVPLVINYNKHCPRVQTYSQRFKFAH